MKGEMNYIRIYRMLSMDRYFAYFDRWSLVWSDFGRNHEDKSKAIKRIGKSDSLFGGRDKI